MAAETTPRRLPLFPLAQVVLFPRTRVPLQVFEPRYRQMTRDVLEGDRRIGMIAVPEEHTAAMAGDPPTFSVGCLGRVTDVRRTQDGRYRFVLSGEARFRVVAEQPRPAERLYRVAEVESLSDPLPDSEASRAAALRMRASELLEDLLRRNTNPERTPGLQFRARLRELGDGVFADALSQALSFSTLEKQGLLESNGVPARLERLVGLLDFKLAELGDPGGEDTPTVH